MSCKEGVGQRFPSLPPFFFFSETKRERKRVTFLLLLFSLTRGGRYRFSFLLPLPLFPLPFFKRKKKKKKKRNHKQDEGKKYVRVCEDGVGAREGEVDPCVFFFLSFSFWRILLPNMYVFFSFCTSFWLFHSLAMKLLGKKTWKNGEKMKKKKKIKENNVVHALMMSKRTHQSCLVSLLFISSKALS